MKRRWSDSDSLLRVLDRVSFATGDIIFREGDEPNHVYVVRRGVVEILKGPVGARQLVTTIRANQMFGELAVLKASRRSATARAKEPTELLVITRDQFQRKVQSLDPFMKAWATYLTSRIFDLTERLDDPPMESDGKILRF